MIGLDDVKFMNSVLPQNMSPGAHAHAPGFTLKFAYWYKALCFRKKRFELGA